MKLKNTLQTLAGFALGGILLYFTLKGKDLSLLSENLLKADWTYSSISLILMTGIFFVRAARWQLLLKESGENPPFKNVLASLGIGYFINSFTPKFGEVARCTSLQTSSEVPLAKSVGVVVSERVYDLIILFAGTLITFLFEIDRLGHLFFQVADNIVALFGSIVLWSGAGLMVLSFFLAYTLRHKLKHLLIVKKASSFGKELYAAMVSSFTLKRYRLFIFYTALIWSSLILLNYLFLQALESTSAEGFYFGTIVLFIAAIGWALPAPGGIGTSHFLVLQLFLVFGMSEDAGIAFGIYSNGLTFAFTIGFGLLSVAGYYINAFRAKQ